MRQAARALSQGLFLITCLIVDALTALAVLLLVVAWSTP